MKVRKSLLVIPVLFLFLGVPGCGGGGGNGGDSGGGNNNGPTDPVAEFGNPDGGSVSSNRGYGFGVSGLLFNNNLLLYDRVRSTIQGNSVKLVLLPQMYFANIDLDAFPVLGTFPKNEVVSGGVKIDDIPALTKPVMVAKDEVGSFLKDSNIVVGLSIDGDTRAYPQNLLWWHEVINDEVGGRRVSITFCPLTGTALTFDDTTPSDRLKMMPVVEATWQRWKQLHPDTQVASGANSNRPLTVYPYGNYRSDNTGPLFPLNRPLDRRFPPKRLVHGIVINDQVKAYPFSSFADKDAVNDVFAGTDVLVVFDKAGQMALSYNRQVGDKTLTFSVVDGGTPFRLKDNETGTIWTVEGRAVEGELNGSSLTRIQQAYNAFWFAWAVFWPNTEVYTP